MGVAGAECAVVGPGERAEEEEDRGFFVSLPSWSIRSILEIGKERTKMVQLKKSSVE